MPICDRILIALNATPGPITYQGLDYLIWARHGIKPPTRHSCYISYIRSVVGEANIIRHHPGVGYELVKLRRPSCERI